MSYSPKKLPCLSERIKKPFAFTTIAVKYGEFPYENVVNLNSWQLTSSCLCFLFLFFFIFYFSILLM